MATKKRVAAPSRRRSKQAEVNARNAEIVALLEEMRPEIERLNKESRETDILNAVAVAEANALVRRLRAGV